MQRHLVLTAAVLAVAASVPHDAAAQERPVTVIVGMGLTGGPSLGSVLHQQETVSATLGGALTPVLGIEVPTRLRGVDVRLTAQRSRPYLWLETPAGTTAIERAVVTNVTADAVINLPGIASVRPYLLAGAGLRRYEFNEDLYREQDSPVIPRDDVEPLVHVGAGVAWKLGPANLFAEASAMSTKYRNQALNPGGRTAGDFHYRVGTRIPLGRSR